MLFSIVATFTGVVDEYSYDIGLSDAIHACKAAGLDPDEPSEPGESEYSYLAEDGPENDWFARLSDVQASGLIDREHLTQFLADLGAYADHSETLGTLGGPLGLGIVPDIPCEIESQSLIASVRVTPVPMRNGEPLIGDERTWPRLRRAFLAEYGL